MSRDWWGEDPEFPVEDWRYEVQADNTRLGYWDWVEVKREIGGDSDG
jgi:hypothetical protein